VLILSISLFLTGIATAVIYQRPWELAMTMEPHHGPARLSGPVRPAIYMPAERATALLPDGRLWVATNYRWKELNQYEQVWDTNGQTNRLRKLKVPIPTGGMFVGGSNWVALAANDHNADVAALQSDGTLWQILSWRDKTNSWNYKFWLGLKPKPRRIGSDNDWKVVAATESYFLAVKTDGTLWGWEGNAEGLFGTNSNRYVAEPERIGTDSDWAALFPQDYSALLMKRDGGIWTWTKVQGEPGLKPIRVEFNGVELNGADWLAVGGNNNHVVVRRDGTLWAWGSWSVRVFGFNTPGWKKPGLARIGADSDWVQISGYYWDLVAIKGGRLLKNGTTLFANALGQPSKYSDWLATDVEGDQLAALAADGTVSMWRDTRGHWLTQFLLAPTHRPFWSLNIFSNSDQVTSRQ
jgi:alpha-tubulin suppressor-like RCC1 family protein